MAQNAPNCKDTQEVQFKLQDRFTLFGQCGEPRSNVKLLAVSSSRGLLFAGNPRAPELKVIIIKDVATAKASGKQPLVRQVPLPNIPNYMSCSADGNLLAINYTHTNGTSLLHIYAVQSFMTPNIGTLYNIRLAPEDHVHAVQLLWNPVLPNNLAVVLSNGALGMYTLKEGGNFELHSLDKSQQVKCGCWSPKGKQIVLGFPDGRLQQFKPDLTPAKTLVCPPNVHDGPFDTIAVHWLSTFQFAVIFLQHGEDCCPALYIVNAPKAGTPTYTNYYDICFSLNGPRNHQFHFTHVAAWNLLLLSSANGVEVGVLGTSEAGDLPSWQQLTLLDEARIELPLSEDTQDETFPLGFVYDTCSTHQLSINEQQLPSMPMVHVLSSEGSLLTFNFLNLQAGAVSVCSPPPPLTDSSGKFCELSALLEAQQPAAAVAAGSAPVATVEPALTPLNESSFAFAPSAVTSTPAPNKEKPASLFGGFGGTGNALNFGAPAAKPFASFGMAAPPAAAPPPATGLNMQPPPQQQQLQQPAQQQQPAATVAPLAQSQPQINKVNNKPLYTVPPTFAPVPATAKPATSATLPKAAPTAVKSELSAGELDDIVADIMQLQIQAFSEQIAQQKQQTRAILAQIESPASIKTYALRLDELQELNEQAQDVDFELDVQTLRQSLNEAYAMMAECRAKLEVYKQPDITRLMSSNSFDAAGRRQLTRLQSYVAANEAQLQLATQNIDAQWEQYQDVLRRSSKSKMHMPCLEGIYQRLTRLQNMASRQRLTQQSIKAKLKDRGLLQATPSRTRQNENVDSLADSILSLSLHQAVDTNRAKLTQQKLQGLRQMLQQHKLHIISPQRPDRVGLKSEVILETKRKAELKKKAAAATVAAAAKPTVAHKATQAAAALPKPTASKPAATLAPAAAAPAPKPTQEQPAANQFVFSQSSPFVKTTAATVTTATLTAAETTKTSSTSFFGVSGGNTSSSFSFAANSKPLLPMGGTSKPAATAGNLFAGFGSTTQEPPKPTLEPQAAKPEQTAPLELKTTAAPAAEPPKPAPKAEAAPKPFSFAGFNSNAGNAIGSSSSTPFSFAGAGSTLSSAAASKPAGNIFEAATVAVSSSSASVTTTAAPVAVATTAAAPVAAAAVSSSSSAEPVDSLFGAVNICKPTTKTENTSAAPANIFGGFGQTTASTASPFASKGLFGSVAAAATTTTAAAIASPFTVTTTAAAIASPFVTTTTAAAIASPFAVATTAATAPVTATTATPVVATTATIAPAVSTATTAAAATTPISTAPAATTAPTAATTSAAPGSSFSFSNAFSSLSAGAPAPATTGTSSVFGGTGNTFAPAAAIPSPFAAAANTPPSTNIFGNVPKPVASVFGASATAAAPPSGLFAAAAAATASPIASPFAAAAPGTPPTPASTGNIFGQAAAAPAPASIFGGAAAAVAPAPAAASPFGGGGSIFGGSSNAQSPATPAAQGSIFGQSVFASAASPATPNNLFGGASAAAAQPQASVFGGGGGSIFGAAAANTAATPASGGSIFGGSSAGFGTFAQSAPAPGGFGSGFAAGGGGSVAQTGFGSPQQQQTPQSPPGAFGAKPVFGGSPAFGASPTFGGAASFGSPKAFGGFGATTGIVSPPAFGAPAAKPPEGNIFDTLGGTDSGLSFGNLAQTGNSNAQKPAYGGSSFMTYR